MSLSLENIINEPTLVKTLVKHSKYVSPIMIFFNKMNMSDYGSKSQGYPESEKVQG